MLDTHPCFIIPFSLCLIGRCSRCWSLGVQEHGDPRCRPPQLRSSPLPSMTPSSPLTRSTLVVPRQEASPFRSCCVCASLLKAPCFLVSVFRYFLLPLTLCSRAIVFEASWPLACIKQLV